MTYLVFKSSHRIQYDAMKRAYHYDGKRFPTLQLAAAARKGQWLARYRLRLNRR